MVFDIEVVSLGGPLCKVKGRPQMSGKELKSAIQKVAGVPIDEQRLFAGNVELQDDTADEVARRLPGEEARVTMVRRRRIKLRRDAGPAEWYALYVCEYKGERPGNPSALVQFTGNRGGRLPYTVARSVFEQFKDPSVPLALIESIEEEPLEVATPPPASRPLSAASTTKEERKKSPVRLSARYIEIGGFSAEEMCAICFEEGGGGAVELLCGGHHRFHKACIDSWLNSPSGPSFNAGNQNTAGWSYHLHALSQEPVGGHVRQTPERSSCPVCRRTALGQAVEARASGTFSSRPAASKADASKTSMQNSWLKTWG